MADYTEQILTALGRSTYHPLKAKALARKLGIATPAYLDFRRTLKELLRLGRIELGKNHTIRPAAPHGTVTGTYRHTSTGVGYVRPNLNEGKPGIDVRIPEGQGLDAATGDLVLVRLLRQPERRHHNPTGRVVRVLERATHQFVGTYFERDSQGYVRVDGTVFSHSILVGDPGAKGARPDDKVVFEMLRFPSPEDRGEGVLTEVLGPRGQPGVDTLAIIRAFNLPDVFPDDALEEARLAADAFREDDLNGREDFTNDVVITIDPVDARDFDDAVALTRDEATGHWELTVHIADVGHFAPAAGPLDREARRRATSVYLPQRVIPMFPEVISNGLASLQQDRKRYVKSVVMGFTPDGKKTTTRFANGVIRNRRRFSYEEVLAVLVAHPLSGEATPEQVAAAPTLDPDVRALLLRLRELALVLRGRRMKRGALDLEMPEAELDLDDQGRVTGAHFASHDLSHQIIEEFMLAANEAVAEHLSGMNVPFLRRLHPDPDPNKMLRFADFVRSLGYKMDWHTDRFALQRILRQSNDRPDKYAVHYALLRSLKQAHYGPAEEGHYALASDTYCHFTSPIRRYPDLTVHRQLDQWLRTRKTGGDVKELTVLGDHCSKMERRAELAERELIKVKILTYLSEHIGEEFDAVITGVADYCFFAQAVQLPAEGLVHISTLPDDYYHYDEATHSLEGRQSHHHYRLGDRVRVVVVRVDVPRRQLDFRVVVPAPKPRKRRGKE
jgi:ribonuclease R